MKIERWNGARSLKQWKADRNGAPTTCQFINGTDATAASPFRKPHDNFYIFASDICRWVLIEAFEWHCIIFPAIFRSVQLFWDEESNYRGIGGFRYSTRDNFLNNIPNCFCINKIKDALTDDAGCLYPGAIDLSECLGMANKRFQRVDIFQSWFLFRCSNCCINAALP